MSSFLESIAFHLTNDRRIAGEDVSKVLSCPFLFHPFLGANLTFWEQTLPSDVTLSQNTSLWI